MPRWLKVSVLSILLLANAAVVGAWWLMDSADTAFRENAQSLEEVVPELDARPAGPTEPMYFLLIGSDSREGVDAKQFGDFKGARGDVVMVARVDPDQGKAQILSIPRDTWVPIEGHGEGKINAAYAYGGPALMVKTVRDLIGVPIHHYVEVDFAGFQALVDEIGGVEMDFENPARDPKSKLDVPAGTVVLDGYQALAYARSRYYQELRDGQWVSVDATDIGRTQRQQALVLAILKRLKRPATLAETGDIVASIAQHMTVDAALAESSLTQLAFSLREIGPSDIETATLPTVGATRGGASIQVLEQPAAAAVLEAFRTGSSLDADGGEAIVSVDVLNANGIAGNAGRWASRLRELGYTVNRVDNADEREDTTVVVVGDDRVVAGEVLVDALGFGAVEVGEVPEGVDAVVLLGADAGDPVS
ncbi:MAG: LCP family protein [Acidimicrobiia bacterium]